MNAYETTQLKLPARIYQFLEGADTLLADLKALGEFSEDTRRKIRSETLPLQISDTLNIEGIAVNPRITKAIMEGGALSESDRYHSREVENTIEAIDFCVEHITSNNPIDTAFIREVHKRLMDRLMNEPGAFRQSSVEITGASFVPPDWAEVLPKIQSLCANLENTKELHPIIRACWLHVAFAQIHPFLDGNGRTARLLQDACLLESGFLPVGVPATKRMDYYKALARADAGEFDDFVQLVAGAECELLETTIRIAQEPIQRRKRIQALVDAANSATRNTRHGQYELWVRRVEALKDEIRSWVSEFNEAAEGISIRIHPINPITYETWDRISKQGLASRNWVLSMTIQKQNSAQSYSVLLFARCHNFSLCRDHESIPNGQVAVMLTAADEVTGGKYEMYNFSDPFIRLREVLFLGNEIIVYYDPRIASVSTEYQKANDVDTEDQWVPVERDSISELVNDLLTDMLLKLGISA